MSEIAAWYWKGKTSDYIEYKNGIYTEHDDPETIDLIRQAVSPMMEACGNSYSNAWLEEWLTKARELGAYEGEVTGEIHDLQNAWSVVCDKREERSKK